MKKLLVANRSEIALRVIRTAKEMGIETVAVYSEPDRRAPYVDQATEAYYLPGDTYNETYLNQDAILDIARRSGADAIHPGYGFLSESADFAAHVLERGLIWVGPRPQVLEDLGDKISARRVAHVAQVPPVPGISEPVDDVHTLVEFGASYGYPVMMKRTDGGGGRGITVVKDEDGLRSFYSAHDSLQGSDLGKYFIEKFVAHARHVETQCGRDSLGNFTVYSARDCSVQRRNQKLIEEAPAPFLSDKVQARLMTYSRRLFDSVGYEGLGTCEFMVTPTSDVYFLEVNPRLQVEHTVSEEVCGIDLVREQLNIADGKELTRAGEPRGHSFELRITSEDPQKNLTPGSGTIEHLHFPSGPGIRIDFGVAEGNTVSPKFDSMMGKIIITARTREEAIPRVLRALDEFEITGITTPCELYRDIFHNPDFTAENGSFAVTTRWLEKNYLSQSAASARAGMPQSLVQMQSPQEIIGSVAPQSFIMEINGKRVRLNVPTDFVGLLTQGRLRSQRRPAQPLRGNGLSTAHADSGTQASSDSHGQISAPMQAVVTRVNVATNQKVSKGDLLVVLESMKMENYVYAPLSGRVAEIMVGPSDSVDAGDPLVTISQDGPGEASADPEDAGSTAADRAGSTSGADGTVSRADNDGAVDRDRKEGDK